MNTFKRLIGIGDREFYRNLLKLSLPIIIQNGLQAMLYLVDNVMVGGLGEVELAAVGAANQLNFLFTMFTFGICSGASILIAQYWGNKDVMGIRRMHGFTLLLSVGISLCFVAMGTFGGKFVLQAFSHDPIVIGYGIKFLRIASIGYLFQSVSIAYLCALRSSENVVLPMVSSMISIAVNTVLNYVLIYGKLGFPAMGVEGSATGTLIATFVGMMITITQSYRLKNVLAGKLSEMFSFDFAMVKKFFKIGTPVMINEALWSFGTVLYGVLYGLIGTKAVAAMQIHATLDRISFVIFIGVGNACAIMIGNRIGEGRSNVAMDYSRRFLVLGAMAGVVAGLIIFAGGPLFVRLYNVTPEVQAMALNIMRVFALGIWMFVCNFIIVIGVLRAGGDTRYSTILDLLPLWTVALPLAYFVALVLKWPMWAVYATIIPSDTLKLIFGLRRVRRGTWINNLTERKPECLQTSEPAFEGEASLE